MRWPWKRDESKESAAAAVSPPPSSSSSSAESSSSSSSSFTQLPAIKQFVSWTDSLNKTDWQHYKDPQAWAPPVLAVGAALGFSAFYRSYLRRIPSTNHIQPRFFRRRSLLGRVTSVGDGDNFHLYHTPGGRLAGWGWLRKVPSYRKDLKGKTIPVRIAGIDAPECAHFGHTAQPYSGEALDFLTSYLLGRRVRAYLYRRDQYDRVVARVVVRRFFFFRRDVGLEMLKRGLATCYEAKTGVEFGGREAQYRVAEVRARAGKRGLWSGGSGKGGKGDVETPREYKTRIAAADAENTRAPTAASTAVSAAAVSKPTPVPTPAAVAATGNPATPAKAKPSAASVPVGSSTSAKEPTATAASPTTKQPSNPAPSSHSTLSFPSFLSSPSSSSLGIASWSKGPAPGAKQ